MTGTAQGSPAPLTGRPRIGVVGTGWWATTAHLPALAGHPGADLVAVCDPLPDRARAAAERFGAPQHFTDVAALLDAGLVDGVVVATPHTSHHSVARAVLDAGVHVLVEKPLTTTATDAWDLVERAEGSGLHLTVGYTYQHTTDRRVRPHGRTGADRRSGVRVSRVRLGHSAPLRWRGRSDERW